MSRFQRTTTTPTRRKTTATSTPPPPTTSSSRRRNPNHRILVILLVMVFPPIFILVQNSIQVKPLSLSNDDPTVLEQNNAAMNTITNIFANKTLKQGENNGTHSNNAMTLIRMDKNHSSSILNKEKKKHDFIRSLRNRKKLPLAEVFSKSYESYYHLDGNDKVGNKNNNNNISGLMGAIQKRQEEDYSNSYKSYYCESFIGDNNKLEQEEEAEKGQVEYKWDSFHRLVFDYSSTPIPRKTTLPDPKVAVGRKTKHSSSPSTLAVFVVTARNHFERRRVIRNTWCLGHYCIFVIGGKPPMEEETWDNYNDNNNENNNKTTKTTNCTIQQMLEKEQKQYHDLLDVIHPESYKSLTYKVLYSYKWSLQNLPWANWIMKIDDDSYARIGSIEQHLLSHFNASLKNYVIGCIVPAWKYPVLNNETESKYADLVYNQSTTYPSFPNGCCGHIVGKSVRDFLATMKNPIYYSNEDASIGIWLEEHRETFPIQWVGAPFNCRGNCITKASLSIGHSLTPQQIQKCYKSGDEWEDTRRPDFYARLLWRDGKNRHVHIFNSTVDKKYF